MDTSTKRVKKKWTQSKNILQSNLHESIREKMNSPTNLRFAKLNPQSGYLKIGAYLLNLVSHDFWHYFLFVKLK